MKKFIIYILVAIVYSSCNDSDTYNTVTVENKYSVAIPAFLVKTNDLNEDASLQYQNSEKEFYTIIIDESIAEFNEAMIENELTDQYSMDLNGYSNVITDVFVEGLQVYNETDFKDVSIAGLSSKIKEIEGKISDIDVYYYLTIVEGKDSYYQILSWTQLGKKDGYRDVMSHIGQSFSEN